MSLSLTPNVFQSVTNPMNNYQGSSSMTVQENRNMTLSPTQTLYQSVNNPINNFHGSLPMSVQDLHTSQELYISINQMNAAQINRQIEWVNFT